MAVINFNIDFIKLFDIQIKNASINNNSGLSSLEGQNVVLHNTYSFDSGISLSEKKIRIIFKCEFSPIAKMDIKIDIAANFDIVYIFIIENIQDLVNQDQHGYTIEEQTMLNLLNITYTTTRGKIYS